jgi:hypothetical protein
MNEHQGIMNYLIAKGEDSWDVGFRATRILREIRKIQNEKTTVHLGVQERDTTEPQAGVEQTSDPR